MRTSSRVLVAVATVAVLVAGCSSESDLLFAGSATTDVDETLEDVRRTFVEHTTDRDDITVGDDPACYLRVLDETDDGADLDDAAWCGPVSERFGDGPWTRVTLETEPADDDHVWLSPGSVASGTHDTDVDMLYHPDGDTPPDELFIAPPAADDNMVEIVDELGFTLGGDPFDHAPVRFGSHVDDDIVDYPIVETLRTDELGDGYGLLTAPDGHDILAVEHDFPSDDAGRLTAVIDDERRSVEGWATGRYLLLTVPSDADVAFEWERDGRSQTIDLDDGTIDGDVNPLLYRNVDADFSQAYEGTADVEEVELERVTNSAPFQVTASWHIDGLSLRETAPDGYVPDDDMAMLWVNLTSHDLDYTDTQGGVGNRPQFGDPWFGNVELVDGDDTYEPHDNETVDGYLVIPVPPEFESGTLHFEPAFSWRRFVSTRIADGDFTLSAEQWDIEVPH